LGTGGFAIGSAGTAAFNAAQSGEGCFSFKPVYSIIGGPQR